MEVGALTPEFVSQLHKRDHFLIHIFFHQHSEVMVVLLVIARNVGDFLKAQIIGIRFLKREDYMNEILP